MRGLAGILIGAAMLATGPAVATTTTPPPREAEETAAAKGTPSAFDSQMQAIMANFMAQNFAAARDGLVTLHDGPEFAALTPARKHALLSLLALTEVMTGASTDAYNHLIEAGPATGDASDQGYYFAMVLAAAATDHKDDGLAAMTGLASVAPDKVSVIDFGYVSELERYAAQKADGATVRKRYLEALWTAGYHPPDIYVSAEDLWFKLFEIEVADGNDIIANQIADGFTEPKTVMRLRCDKRYGRFLVANPKLGDFQATLDASIDNARKLMTDHPRDLEAVNLLASRLANTKRLDEALKLSDDTLARIAAAPKDAPLYDDQAERLQWVHMTRAQVMQRLGRRDDELATQQTSLDSAKATSHDNISQFVNLGDIYYATGRPQDALDIVKDADLHGSPYGKMAVMNVRACAYAQLGDTVHLTDVMDYMKAHADDGFGPYLTSLECTGDEAGLAAVLISRLDNPITRNDTLLLLQTLLTVPSTDYDKKLQAVWCAGAGRTEVQTAIEKYGTVESYPVYSLYF